MMDAIQTIKDHYREARLCEMFDWEYNSGGNGINCCEAVQTLEGLIEDLGIEVDEPTREEAKEWFVARGNCAEDFEDYYCE